MTCVYFKQGHKRGAHRYRLLTHRPLAPAIGLGGGAAALLTSLVGVGAAPATAVACANLTGLALPDTTITVAEPIAAGTYKAPDGEVFLPTCPRFDGLRPLGTDLGLKHQHRGRELRLWRARQIGRGGRL